MKFYNPFLLHTFFALFFCASSQKNDSSLMASIKKGSIMGIVEVTVDQPLVFIKNELQRRVEKDLQSNQSIKKGMNESSKKMIDSNTVLEYIKKAYRGYPINAASMAPITAAQMGTNTLLANSFDIQTSLWKKMLAAFAAGGISALLSSPAEQVMLLQQGSGKSLVQTAQIVISQQSISGLYRGLFATAIRDGGFTAGYLALAPEIKKRFIKTDYELASSIASGIPAGLFAAFLTHPFDVAKTRMQEDYARKIYFTLPGTVRIIFYENGLSSLFAGFSPRAFRIMSAICIMNYLNTKLTNKK